MKALSGKNVFQSCCCNAECMSNEFHALYKLQSDQSGHSGEGVKARQFHLMGVDSFQLPRCDVSNYACALVDLTRNLVSFARSPSRRGKQINYLCMPINSSLSGHMSNAAPRTPSKPYLPKCDL